jgi:hypothetical protein
MIRAVIYDLVARNRYRWFGRSVASCRSFVAIVNHPETAGRWRLAPAGMTKEAALFNSVPDAGEQLKALGHDDHPNVGNLIGYSYREPGDYKFSQVWYERAESRSEPFTDVSITACGKLSRATAIKRTKMQKGRASLPGLSFFS